MKTIITLNHVHKQSTLRLARPDCAASGKQNLDLPSLFSPKPDEPPSSPCRKGAGSACLACSSSHSPPALRRRRRRWMTAPHAACRPPKSYLGIFRAGSTGGPTSSHVAASPVAARTEGFASGRKCSPGGGRLPGQPLPCRVTGYDFGYGRPRRGPAHGCSPRSRYPAST